MLVKDNVNGDIDINRPLDLIWGVDAISQELNLSRRQTITKLESGRLPARKHSGKWCASRTGLRRVLC